MPLEAVGAVDFVFQPEAARFVFEVFSSKQRECLQTRRQPRDRVGHVEVHTGQTHGDERHSYDCKILQRRTLVVHLVTEADVNDYCQYDIEVEGLHQTEKYFSTNCCIQF